MFFYIHIPFCASKCKYCSFVSFAGKNQEFKNKYLDFLKSEIKNFFEKECKKIDSCLLPLRSLAMAKHGRGNDRVDGNDKTLSLFPSAGERAGVRAIESIYFGGGTPSLLSLEEIGDILNTFKNYGNLEKTEITFEMNPENVNEEYVRGLKKIGINRLSIGVQSLNNKTLKEIGRNNKNTIFDALDIIKKVGFENVGVDFILGLPYDKIGDTKKHILKLLDKYSEIKHLSLYMLENSKYPSNWKDVSIKKEDYFKEYGKIVDLLKNKNFSHYEVSNFAKNGYKCRHNENYWNHGEYRGFGLNASNFIGNKRFTNSANFINYYENKLDFEEDLNEKNLKIEKTMFGLRTFNLNQDLIENKQCLEEFINDGLIEKNGDKIRPTISGIMILDYLVENLI